VIATPATMVALLQAVGLAWRTGPWELTLVVFPRPLCPSARSGCASWRWSSVGGSPSSPSS
jgi:hypothetical protein